MCLAVKVARKTVRLRVNGGNKKVCVAWSL